MDIDSDLYEMVALIINEEYFNYINNNFILNPLSLPMLCPPNKWSNNEFGGFLNNKIEKHSIISGTEDKKHLLPSDKIEKFYIK
jgi:DNA-directed RNA polymerase